MLYFKDLKHQRCHSELLKKADKDNKQVLAAVYALAATGKEKVKEYIQNDRIDFDSLFEDAELWSSSEKALIKLAATLYNSSTWPVTIGDVFYPLDTQNIQVVLDALKMRYLA